MSKYKAIGFDYGGVVYGEPSRLAFKEYYDVIGVTPDEFKDAWNANNHRVNKEGISFGEMYKLVLETLGKQDRYPEVMALHEKHENGKKVNQEVLDLASALRSKGFKVGLLSNANNEMANWMKEQKIFKYFDVVDPSCDIKFMKPEVEAFQTLANDLGVKPEEMIFIDDNEKPLSNCEEIGVVPILFTSVDQIKQELSKLGIDSG